MLIRVLLPLPLERLFTYQVPEEDRDQVLFGKRVAVPFGRSRILTGLIIEGDSAPEEGFETRDVIDILDKDPIVQSYQWDFWKWVARYYMCSPGEVLKYALPPAYFLESETRFLWNPEEQPHTGSLSDEEYLVWEALQKEPSLDLSSLGKILHSGNPLKLIERLRSSGQLLSQEQARERYKPKMKRYLSWHPDAVKDEVSRIVDGQGKAYRQREALLQFIRLRGLGQDLVGVNTLTAVEGVTASALKALVDKEILQEHWVQEDRLSGVFPKTPGDRNAIPEVPAEGRLRALLQESAKPVLFRYGNPEEKALELYSLLAKAMKGGEVVLYIVPELSYLSRTREELSAFTPFLRVNHPRLNSMERLEFWKRCLTDKGPFILLGTRSALFLPVPKPDLILFDESHDGSYKQFDPAPRYHGRDAGVYLAHLTGAATVLVSASPCVESIMNARNGKYRLLDRRETCRPVRKDERIEVIDLKESHKRKQMQGMFSLTLLEAIRAVVSSGKRAVLFLNRRGYAPVLECTGCGQAVQCPNCDVSMTYHLQNHTLSCHYCGLSRGYPDSCESCGTRQFYSRGVGSEQAEEQLSRLLPDIPIGRMDQETTRGKKGHQTIAREFSEGKFPVMVGTQMLIKGLDYSRVGLIGVLNADAIWNFPDYRSAERAYQLLDQLIRRTPSAAVFIQAYQAAHVVLRRLLESDYDSLIDGILAERRGFNYPPFTRLIRITLKGRTEPQAGEAAEWLAKALRMRFPTIEVLGPEPPHVPRVRRWFLRQLLLKVPGNAPISVIKKGIKRTEVSLHAISKFGSVRVVYDVDHI